MNRISPVTKKRIVHLWFQGWPRDQIATKLGVSGGTVSNTVYLLPEVLKELRSTSMELRKLNLSPSEAAEGARLIAKLKRLDIRPHELESYIEVSTKFSKEADYEPARVVKGAMTLFKLEAEAGKPYVEALQEFQATTKRNDHLKAENRKLDAERKQRLAQAKVTEEEIQYIQELRGKLRTCGIDVSDVEALHQYLQNMKETNRDPRKFAEYTRKHGSLKRRSTMLRKQIEAKEKVLHSFHGKIENCRTQVRSCLAVLSQLNAKIHETGRNLKTLQQKERETQARLSDLLEVESEAKTIKEALDSLREKLDTLKTSVEEARQAGREQERGVQEAEVKNQYVQFIEREIAVTLKILDHIKEKQAAMRARLLKEIIGKSSTQQSGQQ